MVEEREGRVSHRGVCMYTVYKAVRQAATGRQEFQLYSEYTCPGTWEQGPGPGGATEVGGGGV